MKICIVTSTFPRYIGDSRGPWILEYALQLVKLGVEVHVLCPGTNLSRENANEIMKGVYIHRFSFWPIKRWQNLASPPGIIPNLKNSKISKFQVIPFLILGCLSLFKLVKKYKIDLIFAQWVIPAGFWGVIVKRVTKLPVIISAQGAEFFVKNNIVKILIRDTMQKTDLVLPVSYHMAKLGISLGLKGNKIRIIPNAVNTDFFKRDCPHRTSGTFRVLTVRRLVPEKRVHDLIKAFEEFIKEYPDVQLTIIGDGPERDRLEKLVKELKCTKKIKFLGSINNSELPYHYNEADIYVLSSVQEGLSLSLLEAMACELPIISTNIVGNPEVVQHLKNGYLVSPRSPNEIKKGLIFLYNNRSRLKEFGMLSRNTVKEGFTSEMIAKDIFKICEELVTT